MQRLEAELRRELELDGELYTVGISPSGVRITRKGRRKGHELSWHDLLSATPNCTAICAGVSLLLGCGPSRCGEVAPSVPPADPARVPHPLAVHDASS